MIFVEYIQLHSSISCNVYLMKILWRLISVYRSSIQRTCSRPFKISYTKILAGSGVATNLQYFLTMWINYFDTLRAWNNRLLIYFNTKNYFNSHPIWLRRFIFIDSVNCMHAFFWISNSRIPTFFNELLLLSVTNAEFFPQVMIILVNPMLVRLMHVHPLWNRLLIPIKHITIVEHYSVIV